MKALSLRRPWAGAVAHGGKRLENRTWPWLAKPAAAGRLPSEPIAIHASASNCQSGDLDGVRWGIGGGDFPGAWMQGMQIVAIARIVDVMRAARTDVATAAHGQWSRFELRSDDRDRLMYRMGESVALQQIERWWLGPFALVLDEVRPLAKPVTCKGALGFWTVPGDIATVVWEQAGSIVGPRAA